MKEQISNLKSNPIGLGVGAVAGYLVATKLVKTEKMWMKVAIAIAGGVLGAMVQAKIKAKQGVVTPAIVNAPAKK
jgi:outer membrane lipoprotein SlyB